MQRPSSESSIIQTIYEKEQQNQRAIQQNRDAGIHGRQNVNDALGSLIQPPGNVGQIQRNMNIDAIRARVVSRRSDSRRRWCEVVCACECVR